MLLWRHLQTHEAGCLRSPFPHRRVSWVCSWIGYMGVHSAIDPKKRTGCWAQASPSRFPTPICVDGVPLPHPSTSKTLAADEAISLLVRDPHRFLFQEEDGDIKDYRMRRLTFGVSSSPYLASPVLRRTADDHQIKYPKAARLIKEDFYVDDVVTSVSNFLSLLQHRSGW